MHSRVSRWFTSNFIQYLCLVYSGRTDIYIIFNHYLATVQSIFSSICIYKNNFTLYLYIIHHNSCIKSRYDLKLNVVITHRGKAYIILFFCSFKVTLQRRNFSHHNDYIWIIVFTFVYISEKVSFSWSLPIVSLLIKKPPPPILKCFFL